MLKQKMELPNQAPDPKAEQEKWNKLADQLEEMQKDRNGGLGVSHVRTAIAFLRRGDPASARLVCANECDKFSSCQDIAELLEDELIKGEFVISNKSIMEQARRRKEQWAKEDAEK